MVRVHPLMAVKVICMIANAGISLSMGRGTTPGLGKVTDWDFRSSRVPVCVAFQLYQQR